MNKIALITGATRGIGQAIAIELAKHGVDIAINYKEDERGAKATLEAVLKQKVRGLLVCADVSVPAEVKKMVEEVRAKMGKVDYLINNAGIVRDKMMQNLSSEDWKAVMQVNLDGVFFCTQEVLAGMKERQFGRIVNIASIVGQAGALGQTNYAASKAGMIGFTKAAALELARYNITVNAVCPGYTNTSMLSGIPAEKLEKIKEKIPLKRLAEAGEIAKLVRFLLLEGDYITGQQLNINGGLYL